MKIKFYVLATGNEAILSPDGEEFFINSEGKVVEFVEQLYASFAYHKDRDDLSFKIED
jgi:hypothetical protein